MKDYKVVSVCGFGYTGSGAVIDLLKGFSCTTVIDSFEFSFIYTPDGLIDLKYHLIDCPVKFMSSDIAIKRFKNYMKQKSFEFSKKYQRKAIVMYTDEYIDSISQIEWRGYWMFDYFTGSFFTRNIRFRLFHSRIFKYFPNLSNCNCSLGPNRTMYLSVKNDSFYKSTLVYLSNLIHLLVGPTNDIIVLNQAFSPNNLEACMSFFNGSKAIVVDRDPRDLYVICKKIIPNRTRFVPTQNVDSFIKYYKLVRSNYPRNEPNVLVIKFEDLVYNYDKIISDITCFLGIDEELFSNNDSCFNPSESAKNICIFNNFPELKNDILLIEKELKPYLYHFLKNDDIHNSVSKKVLRELADK